MMDQSINVNDPLKKAVTQQPKEGPVTKVVENVTAKVPSMGYLSLALGSMALSAGIALFSERKALANFVGLWVPSFMLVGIYNKLVKLEGNDAFNKPATLH
jgi:hypothetical protein